MRKTLAIFMSVLLFLGQPLPAVMHLHPNTFPKAFRDMMHHPSLSKIHAAGSLRAAVASSAIGTKRVAVIIVQFPAGNAQLTSGSHSIISVSNIESYMNEMKVFYDEASYHKLNIRFSYFNSDTTTPDGDDHPSANQSGVYTLSQPMEYYGCGDEGVGCANTTIASGSVASPTANGDYLIHDALVAARTGHSNTPSQVDAGGSFDAVVVVHAGNGQETTGSQQNPNAGDIWSIFYSQEAAPGGTIGSAGGGWAEGDVVPETESSGIISPLGVICHEFGHELGLPDEYNTGVEGGTSVVGNWELMDSGPFDGQGANPSHPGAWDLYTLGWATPQVVSTKAAISTGFVESDAGNMIKIPVQNGQPLEYFLGEYRSRSSGATYDRALPGDGLLVWHVDDAITNARGVGVTDPNLSNTVNVGPPTLTHYGISIVTADGATISNSNQGDAGNPFTVGESFTSPQSNNFDGEPTKITLTDIQQKSGGVVNYDVANVEVGNAQDVEKMISFPNPAGKGYRDGPYGEGHMTLQFQLTRPFANCDLNIYTLSGDLVRKLGKGDISFDVNHTADNKWVYQYVWDLTNGEGHMVASGVYLFLLRVDGKNRTTKAVVIR